MIKLCLLNFAESGKGSFYILREWLEGYKYGKGMFYSEYGDDKNYTSNTMPTTYSRRIVFFLIFSPFSPIFDCFFQAMRKGFSRSIYDTNK